MAVSIEEIKEVLKEAVEELREAVAKTGETEGSEYFRLIGRLEAFQNLLKLIERWESLTPEFRKIIWEYP